VTREKPVDLLPTRATCAAVAASLAAAAIGTDTGGSIRVPAAHQNLVGLLATRGYCASRFTGRLAIARPDHRASRHSCTVRTGDIDIDACAVVSSTRFAGRQSSTFTRP
jgi:hypothetical protein